ncbi:MAG: disulfide bond formation protein B [Patescibacteria group bacterium]|nr:disulfide bond formation protein B [Patescibacteria group bacterium]MCX7589944.1 disulfide bond formation protein B [Patescibacteria group bacterium]MDW8279778.1 disulfide bond formation protein B [bacterium]
MNIIIFNKLISFLGIIAQILIAFLIFIFFFKKNSKIFIFFSKNSFLFSFIIALSATTISLFYFEIFGIEPCLLCWYQRIFMYPQTILLGLSILQNDKNIKKYIITLALIGLLIALYHNIIQINSDLNTICSIENSGNLLNCSQKYIIGFNYITIPFMSLLSFMLILILMFFNKQNNLN